MNLLGIVGMVFCWPVITKDMPAGRVEICQFLFQREHAELHNDWIVGAGAAELQDAMDSH